MRTEDFLRQAAALPGLTGNEGPVAQFVAQAFRPLADEVRIDALNSVVAHKRGPGPKVVFCAHLDEIGLMVTRIENDGCLRLGNVGGVDPRILPGMMVTVYGTEKLIGVVGAKAPHLLGDEEREKNYRREDLYVDLGLAPDIVREKVHIGDLVTLEARFVPLQNNRFCTKTADDRACVAILYRALQLLQNMKHTADLYFVATCQEETGSWGALTAGFGVDPDMGVALDVCHAQTPDAPKARTHKLDSLVASMGPYIQPVLRQKLMDVAKQINVQIQTAVVSGHTFTDADNLGIARAGVPTVLLELPLKYMHTTVEQFDMHTLEEGARLVAHFAAAIDDSWEAALWN